MLLREAVIYNGEGEPETYNTVSGSEKANGVSLLLSDRTTIAEHWNRFSFSFRCSERNIERSHWKEDMRWRGDDDGVYGESTDVEVLGCVW